MLSSPSSKSPANSSKKKTKKNKVAASSKPNAPAAKKPVPEAKKPSSSNKNTTKMTKQTNQAANRPNAQGNKTNSKAAPEPKIKSPSFFSSFNLEKLCFMLTFNKIEITADHREALTQKVIDECYRPVEKPYISSKIYFTHDEIIEVVKFLTTKSLSDSKIEALKNIAYQLTAAFKSITLDDVQELEKLMGLISISNPVQEEASENKVQKSSGEVSLKVLSQDQAEQMVSLFRPINTTQNSFNSEQLVKLLRVFSKIEPRNMTYVVVVTEILWVLLNKCNLKDFNKIEIFNITNYAMMAARPITGNLGICLFHLTNYILNNYKPSDLGSSQIPILLKSINFMEACRENMPSNLFAFDCDPLYKKELVQRAKLLLEHEKPNSSYTHTKFCDALKSRLSELHVEVKDEFFCDIVGTHLDIAIPERKIVVEIDGVDFHYNKDGKTGNTKTRYKKELLEAYGWLVVNITDKELNTKKSEPPLAYVKKVDRIISERILPLLVSKPEIKESTLLRDTDPRFCMLPKQIYGHHPEMPLACDFEQKYEKVTDKAEAAKRMHELEEESKRELIPIATCNVEDGSVLTLVLAKTPHERFDEALEAFLSFSATAGRLAVNEDGELDITKLPKVGGSPILTSYARLRDTQATLVKSKEKGIVSDGARVRVTGVKRIPIFKKQ